MRAATQRSNFVPIAQDWDWDHKCDHCGKLWLKGTSKGTRRLCCNNGKFVDPELATMLWPIQETPLYPYMGKYDQEMTKYANVYNNLLALGAYCVDSRVLVV